MCKLSIVMCNILSNIQMISLLCLCWPVVVSSNSNLVEDKVVKVEDYDEPVPRVVNGEPAKLGDFPYQVALKKSVPTQGSNINYFTFCGGAIIGDKKILSAAHCFEKKVGWCSKVFGGGNDRASVTGRYAVAATLTNEGIKRRDGESSEQWRKIKSVRIPKEYDFPRKDIAVAYTTKPFNYNINVNQKPYATKPIDYGKVTCLVAGYGRVRAKVKSPVLMWAHLFLIPSKRCSKIHGQSMKHFVCTDSSYTDVLQGDSGGPLVCYNTGDPNDTNKTGVIVGVVSGARIGHGTFFTRVTSYKKFIESKSKSYYHRQGTNMGIMSIIMLVLTDLY